jgi:hypothetical protein
MFALNFCIIYVFEFLDSIESMKSDERRWLCVTKKNHACSNLVFETHQQTFITKSHFKW